MKYVRFLYEGNSAYGVLENQMICELDRPFFAKAEKTGRALPLEKAVLLPPTDPEKIVGIGLNFMDHIISQGLQVPQEPYIVHRPHNTLNCHEGAVYTRAAQHFVQYEGELVIVIGKRCHNVTTEQAGEYIFGYTIGNDVTEKDFFKADKHFGVAKAFDTQCPIGPWIETEYDWHHKCIRTVINGVERQNGTTDDMVFGCEQLVSYLSSFMTLQPGDLIMTGSPAGVGPLAVGDRVEISIEGLGSLVNEIYDIAE